MAIGISRDNILEYLFYQGRCGTNSFWASMMRSTLSRVEAVEGGAPRISLNAFAIFGVNVIDLG